MLRSFNFITNEDGAVTVDWVVLTAAVIGLGVAVMSSVGAGSTDLADDAQANLTGMEIASYLGALTYGELAGPSLLGVTVGECYLVEDQGICDPDQYISIDQYSMSDGSVWTKNGSWVDGNEEATVYIWKDADGEVVDAPEAT